MSLGRALTGLDSGWVKLSDTMFAVRNQGNQHVDTALCPSGGLLWLRTTLIQLPNGTWEVDEFCASISDLRTMTAPFEASKNVVEVITIAHTTMGPPAFLFVFSLMLQGRTLSSLKKFQLLLVMLRCQLQSKALRLKTMK